MKKSPSYQSHLRSSLREYPGLFGYNPMEVNEQIFVTNGNGMGWHPDGGIISLGSRGPKEKLPNIPKLHAEIFRTLRKIPKVTECRDRECLPHHEGLIWSFPDSHKADEEKWIKTKEKNLLHDISIDARMLLDKFAQPQRFYQLSLKRYSLVAETPKNVRPDYAEAIVSTLLAVLTGLQSEHSQDNRANAIILLTRLRPILAPKCKTYPSKKEILGASEKDGERRLSLDCKRHVGNHSLDESLLSNAEFFELNRLCPIGLSDEEQSLVRRYHQFLEWSKDYSQKTAVEQNDKSRKAEREFWGAVQTEGNKLTITFPTPESEKWARFQKMMASF